ncbi:MAG: DinB family protein [Vicinamibacterales bacterium]|nr:DinB family protein [Vicinamibacterales bacterium]
MAIKDALLPEFDHEMAVARKVIERVDGGQLAWQPHEKSMTLGRLATHVAEIPMWGFTILDEPEFNLVSGTHTPTRCDTVAEILALFDAQISKIRSLLDTKTDAELMSTWTFKHDGKELFAMPRVTAWRSWVMNHLIHHRGQLSVYLRLTGSKVPSIYGPSGDEA